MIDPSDQATLDQVVEMWKAAHTLADEADFLEDEAKNKRALSEDKLDEAEKVWQPLLAAHPEWTFALNHELDPRTET